ncbi:hypothetical protein E2320_012305 [Naja naja]|nr:hypothetical protein E2320_012305 [Naja naja]
MRLRRPRRPEQAARTGSGAQPWRAAAAGSPFRRRAAAAAAAKRRRRRRRRRPRPVLERPRRVPHPASQLRAGKAACRRPGASGKPQHSSTPLPCPAMGGSSSGPRL